MTTPGGVPNLPQGALTLSNLASDLQDMSGTAMRSRAVQRFPSIFNLSTGLNPAVDLTPFGILTGIWAEVNSLIANADPADVQGPQDIPALVLQFIEGLPVVGQFIGLLEAILGTYAGTDATLLQVQAIFAPIRAIVDALTAVSGGTGGLGNFFPDLLGVFGLGSSGLGTGSPTIPGVGSIPIFGPLFGLFGGASNSTQAGNFFTSITGLFGNPTGLLTGSPTIPALGSIPILGPVLGLFGGATSATQANNFFTNLLSLLGTPTLTGSTGSFNPATVLTSWINGSINPLNLLTTVTDFTSLLGSFGGATTTGGVNSFITNLLGSFGGATTTTGVNSFITNLLGSFGGATNLTQAGNFFTNLLSILNTPTLTGSPGSFNVNTAATNLINNVLNPTGLLASITAIVNAITGSSGTLTNLTSWINDLTGFLGSPTGLGSGSVTGFVPANNIAGVAGISGMGSTMQGTWDQLYQAFSAITGSNTPLSVLADSAHGTSNTANNALTQTVMNSGMLTGFLTARAANHGLDPTAVASYNLASNSNTALNATSTVAPMSFHIITQPTTFGNFETVGTKSGTVTGFYLNAYRMDATGLLTSVYNSANLSSQLVTTSPGGWVQTGAIPAVNQPAFAAGEVLALESIVVGSGSVALRSQSTGVPNHPTALLQNFAASRNPTGALTPATIAAGAVTYSANQPWHSATVLAVPPGWQPPTTTPFLAGHGTYPYNIPTWAQVAGAKIDLIAVGSGKGGQGEYGTAFPAQGGNPGVFATFRAIYGTDIPLATTQLTVVIAPGGAGVTSYFTDGGNGASTTISVAGGGATLLTAAGGTANAGTVGTGPGPVGTSGNNETFHGYTAFGGTSVGSNATGSPPGGGGGGAFPYSTTSGHGADGGAWITASQP